MLRLMLLPLGLALLPIAAASQSASETSCRWSPDGRWVCKTQAPTEYVKPYTGSPMRQAFEAAELKSEAQSRDREAEFRAEAALIRRERVAAAVMAGDCEGAKRIALEGADIDLAAKAATICVARPAQ